MGRQEERTGSLEKRETHTYNNNINAILETQQVPMSPDWGDICCLKTQDDFTEQVLKINKQYNIIDLAYTQ